MARVRVLLCGLSVLLIMSAFQNCSEVAFEKSLVSEYCGDTRRPEVAPTLMWDWKSELAASSGDKYETFDQVMAAPMVGDLNGDSLPEVVFTTFSVTPTDRAPDMATNVSMYSANGILRVVNGQNGRTLFSIGGTELSPMASQSPLIMDIDNDGRAEIFYTHYLGRHLIAINHDGTTRWKYQLPGQIGMVATGITGANLDGAGNSEINVAGYIVSEDNYLPVLRASLSGAGSTHYSSLALPLNPATPNVWSVVTHNGIFDNTGHRVGAAFPAGVYYLAAGDIAPSVPGIEIVATGQAKLMILNGLDGSIIKSVDLTAYNDLTCKNADGSVRGIGGGPPSIGDFDGDASTLEIAVATGRHLTIFDDQAIPKYKTVTQDCSSLVTGLTTFDMNADGKPEILYSDEEYFRIFEIRNGQLEIVQSLVNPSGTLYEYPVVADLQGGGRGSNLILASNNYAVGGFYKEASEAADGIEAQGITGVRAFRSTGDRAWAPTHPVWNQFSFHPDLVNFASQFKAGPRVDSSMFRRNAAVQYTELRCGKDAAGAI